ncbi:MAG: hypothetical protein GX589_04890 [Deltaproteobacteria bacterium]|nr:hypothetical protein [Deltaproteobacteria bacterium]
MENGRHLTLIWNLKALGLGIGALCLAIIYGNHAAAQVNSSAPGYLTFIIEKAKEVEKKEVGPNIEKWAKGNNVNPWDRGAMEKQLNFEIAKAEMHMYMGTPEAPGECGMPIKIRFGCNCFPHILLPEFYWHYYAYYLPVAIVEGSEVAFRTAFEDKVSIKKLLAQATLEHHAKAPVAQTLTNLKINKQAKMNNWGYEVAPDVATAEPADEQNRFRSYKPGSFISMFPHVFNTGDPKKEIKDYHTEHKNDNKRWWIHRGSVLPAIPAIGLRKPPVPKMIMEGHRWNDVGRTVGKKPEFEPVTYMYHNFPTYIDEQLRRRALLPTSKETYRDERHYDPSQGHTPRDILPPELKFALDQMRSGEKGLLEGNLSGQGPFTGMVFQTLYGPTAGLVAIHRGLAIVTDKFPSRELDPGALYHPYRFDGVPFVLAHHPRARFQWLSSVYNKELPKGCSKWLKEKDFIPNWWGFQAEDANLNLTKNHNYTFGAVVWNPMRGCHAPCRPWPWMPHQIVS